MYYSIIVLECFRRYAYFNYTSTTHLKLKVTEPIQANEVFKVILLSAVTNLAQVSKRCSVILVVEGNAPGLAHALVSTVDHRDDVVLSDHVMYQHSIFPAT